ncbi:MAG: hypothetical protein ACKVQC_10705 [Elusimicrobiota bacterium]
MKKLKNKQFSFQLADLEKLVGTICHDLNNIQSAMFLGIQILEKEIAPTPDGKIHLENFRKVSERIGKLSVWLKNIKETQNIASLKNLPTASVPWK